MQGKELLQVMTLVRVQSMGPAAQEAQPGPVPAQVGTELPSHAHQVQADQADRVEPVRHDSGRGGTSV